MAYGSFWRRYMIRCEVKVYLVSVLFCAVLDRRDSYIIVKTVWIRFVAVDGDRSFLGFLVRY